MRAMAAFHDPIPYDALVAKIAIPETIASAQASLYEAWREYADHAARPYAWATFAKRMRTKLVVEGIWPLRGKADLPPNRAGSTPLPLYQLEKLARPGAKKAQQSTISRYKKPKEERQASDNSKALKTSPLIGVESKSETLSPWAHVAPAVPRVLVLSAFAALRVRGGALEIDHGPQKDRRSLRFDVDASKPAALLFDSHGEHMSGEALRWCTRHGIALILPNGPDGFLSLMATCADTPDASPADPGLMLTQCRAALDPATAFCIARAIVQAKIDRANILSWTEPCLSG